MPDGSSAFPGYPTDIATWVVEHFETDSMPRVRSLLEELKSERLMRCALFLSRGSMESLKSAVDLGRMDYRDLIVAAEYDRQDNHIRDFNRPFSPNAQKG